jgi:hypothetical protein
MISYFFHNFIGKNHFAMSLYLKGSFFPALAARDTVGLKPVRRRDYE